MPEPTQAEIGAVIQEFGGDLREAIRALLGDVATLDTDYEAAVSGGYDRGRQPADGDWAKRSEL